jgi:hypothetical protein
MPEGTFASPPSHAGTAPKSIVFGSDATPRNPCFQAQTTCYRPKFTCYSKEQESGAASRQAFLIQG